MNIAALCLVRSVCKNMNAVKRMIALFAINGIIVLRLLP